MATEGGSEPGRGKIQIKTLLSGTQLYFIAIYLPERMATNSCAFFMLENRDVQLDSPAQTENVQIQYTFAGPRTEDQFNLEVKTSESCEEGYKCRDYKLWL